MDVYVACATTLAGSAFAALGVYAMRLHKTAKRAHTLARALNELQREYKLAQTAEELLRHENRKLKRNLEMLLVEHYGRDRLRVASSALGLSRIHTTLPTTSSPPKATTTP